MLQLNEYPDVLTMPDIAKYMRISRAHAYELAKHKDFPAIRVGRSIRVYKESFARWLERKGWSQLDK